jgi:arginyl-tRNA synthetase
VQYAHARICSVLSLWANEHRADARPATEGELQRLTAPSEAALMRELARFPDVLARAADEFAPHDLAFYLRDVAAAFHTYYSAERFMVDDAELARARMALLTATRQVLRNGFAVLGISAPDSMARESHEES